MAYKYKTRDGSDVVIPGIGVTVNGEIVSEKVLEIPSLVPVAEDAPAQPTQQAVPQPAAAPNEEQK